MGHQVGGTVPVEVGDRTPAHAVAVIWQSRAEEGWGALAGEGVQRRTRVDLHGDRGRAGAALPDDHHQVIEAVAVEVGRAGYTTVRENHIPSNQ